MSVLSSLAIALSLTGQMCFGAKQVLQVLQVSVCPELYLVGESVFIWRKFALPPLPTVSPYLVNRVSHPPRVTLPCHRVSRPPSPLGLPYLANRVSRHPTPEPSLQFVM